MMKYLRDKTFLAFSAIYLIVSVAILYQPLFNYLGFEFSAITGITSFFITAAYTYILFKRRNSKPRKGTFAGLISESLVKNYLLILIPFICGLINMIFVKNCSVINGILFYLLIPCITVFYSAALSLFIYSFFNKFKKVFLSLFFLAILLFSASEYYFNPQLFVYNPFAGFFPGMLYDEELYISYNFLLYRLNNIVQAFILLSFANIFYQLGDNVSIREKVRKIKYAFRSPVILFMFFLTLLFLFFRNELHITAEKGYVASYLGSLHQTRHFNIYYSSKSLNDKEIKDIADLHEFYYYKICRELEVDFSQKIESFVYPDAQTKHLLIGAKYTIIAKPWLNQVHINKGAIEETLKHELVHIIAGEFGIPLLKIGRSAAVLEGLAMAVEWQWGYRTLHDYSASIFGYIPQIEFEKILSSSGFLSSNPNVSYVLSGSFIKYIMNNYGTAAVKQIYYDDDFQQATGKETGILIREWKAYLAKFHSFSEDSIISIYTFKRPSIFQKVCARVIANINEEAYQEQTNGNYSKSIELYRKSISLSNNSPAYSGLVISLLRSGSYDSVLSLTAQLLQNEKTGINFLPLKLYRADAYWLKAVTDGNTSFYDSAYQECSEVYNFHLNENYDFASRSRMSILNNTQLRVNMLKYYAQLKDDGLRILHLSETINSNPNFPLGKIIMARLLFNKAEYLKSREYLEKTNDGFLSNYFLGEKYKLLGLSYIKTGNYSTAVSALKRSLDFIDNESSRNEISERIEFALFLEK